MYKAMAALNYDAVTLGNHEFNFGLAFLYNAMEGSKGKLRFVNSNVKDLEGNPIVSRSTWMDKRSKSSNERSQTWMGKHIRSRSVCSESSLRKSCHGIRGTFKVV